MSLSKSRLQFLLIEHCLPVFIFLFLTLVLWHWYPWIAYSCIGTDAAFANGAQINFHFLNDQFSGNDRRLERLPSVLPGLLLFSLLPPVLAHQTAFLLTSTLISFLFFRVARKFGGYHTALFAALLLLFNPWIIGTTNSFYVNRELLVYSGLVLLFSVNSVEKNDDKIYLLLTGITTALAIFTHPISLVFLGYSPIFYLVSKCRTRKEFPQKLLRYLIFVGLGGLLCFSTLGLINKVLLGNGLNFLATQGGMASSIYSAYFREFYQVFSTSIPISFVVLGVMGAIIPLIFSKYYAPRTRTFSISFIAYTTLYSVGYYINTFLPETPILIVALWLGYYYPLLIPICLFAMTLPLFRRNSGSNLIWWTLIVLLLVLTSPKIFGLRYELFNTLEYILRSPFIMTYTGFIIALGAIGYVIGASLMYRGGRLVHGVSLVIVSMVIFNQSSERKGNCQENASFYQRMYDGNYILQDTDLKDPKNIIFWIADNGNPKIHREYYHIAWLWLHYRVINNFGDIQQSATSPLFSKLFEPGQEFVLMDYRKGLKERAEKLFCQKGVGFEQLNSSEIGTGVHKFTMFVGRTTIKNQCSSS